MEIREFQLQGGDEFMILACDGIWDVLTRAVRGFRARTFERRFTKGRKRDV